MVHVDPVKVVVQAESWPKCQPLKINSLRPAVAELCVICSAILVFPNGHPKGDVLKKWSIRANVYVE